MDGRGRHMCTLMCVTTGYTHVPGVEGGCELAAKVEARAVAGWHPRIRALAAITELVRTVHFNAVFVPDAPCISMDAHDECIHG